MTIHLNGLALKNFRGIGPEWVIMSGFSKFNFFIGPNNAGKSTVLGRGLIMPQAYPDASEFGHG